MQYSARDANGHRLIEMRKEAGIAKKDVPTLFNQIAEREGLGVRIGRRAIDRWETLGTERENRAYGTQPPTLTELAILLEVYNGNPDYLLTGNGSPLRKEQPISEPILEIITIMSRWTLARQRQVVNAIKDLLRID